MHYSKELLFVSHGKNFGLTSICGTRDKEQMNSQRESEKKRMDRLAQAHSYLSQHNSAQLIHTQSPAGKSQECGHSCWCLLKGGPQQLHITIPQLIKPLKIHQASQQKTKPTLRVLFQRYHHWHIVALCNSCAATMINQADGVIKHQQRTVHKDDDPNVDCFRSKSACRTRRRAATPLNRCWQTSVCSASTTWKPSGARSHPKTGMRSVVFPIQKDNACRIVCDRNTKTWWRVPNNINTWTTQSTESVQKRLPMQVAPEHQSFGSYTTVPRHRVREGPLC